MLRNMATSLIERDSIKTTVAKAKALRPIIDRLITWAKKGDLPAIRSIAAVLMTKAMVKRLLEIKGRFSDRSCGYTLMAKTGHRLGDAAPMCVLSLIKPEDSKAATGLSAPASKTVDRGRRVAASKAKDAKSPVVGGVEAQASPDEAAAVLPPGPADGSADDEPVAAPSDGSAEPSSSDGPAAEPSDDGGPGQGEKD
jgi:large subunit ribosomal protein L17